MISFKHIFIYCYEFEFDNLSFDMNKIIIDEIFFNHFSIFSLHYDHNLLCRRHFVNDENVDIIFFLMYDFRNLFCRHRFINNENVDIIRILTNNFRLHCCHNLFYHRHRINNEEFDIIFLLMNDFKNV